MLKIETGKLSAKGVVAIPVKVRNMLGVEEGDRLAFIQSEDGSEMIVRGVKTKTIFDAFGILDLKEPLRDVRELRDQYREKRIEDDLNRRM